MRLVDIETGKTLASVALLLTPSEASELADKIGGLDPSAGDHAHVADVEYQREITVAIYTPDNLSWFSEDVRKVIRDDGGDSHQSGSFLPPSMPPGD